MRALRFRIWDTWMKTFIDDPGFGISLLGTLQINGHPTVNPNRYVIQQFTGLADKHNTSIYEGDIITVFPFNWHRYGGEPHPFLVMFSERAGAWIVKDERPVEACPPLYDRDDWVYRIDVSLEVIGNIYENPELLPEGALT